MRRQRADRLEQQLEVSAVNVSIRHRRSHARRIDVSSVNNINVGDEVIVFGNGGDKQISLEELAAKAGTVPHEILSLTGNRTPRVFIKDGKIIDVLTYL